MKLTPMKVEPFTDHIDSVNRNFKFTWEDTSNNKLPSLDCAKTVEEDRSLRVETNRKPTTQTCLRTSQESLEPFTNQNHPLEEHQHERFLLKTGPSSNPSRAGKTRSQRPPEKTQDAPGAGVPHS